MRNLGKRALPLKGETVKLNPITDEGGGELREKDPAYRRHPVSGDGRLRK